MDIRGFASFLANGASGLSPTMRQTYAAGDKLFVDWAGGHGAGHRCDDGRGA
jgi:hypothetical protein